MLKKADLYYAVNKDTDDAVVKEFQDALNAVKSKLDFQTVVNKYLK